AEALQAMFDHRCQQGFAVGKQGAEGGFVDTGAFAQGGEGELGCAQFTDDGFRGAEQAQVKRVGRVLIGAVHCENPFVWTSGRRLATEWDGKSVVLGSLRIGYDVGAVQASDFCPGTPELKRQAIKNPAEAGFFYSDSELTDDLNVRSLLALRTSSDVERHLLVLGQGFEALNLDLRE